MKLQSSFRVECPSCKIKTDLFKPTCRHCGFVLRDRVPNVDLGMTIISIIDSPVKTIRKLFFAEKKNFLLFIMIVLAVKCAVINQAIAPFTDGREFFSLQYVWWNVWTLALIVIITSIVAGLVLKVCKSRIRIRDVAATLLYPQILLVITFPFLGITEFIIFGKYMFYKTPNIFFIHSALAYIFTVIEGLLVLWTLALNIIAHIHIASNKILAVLSTIIALFLVYVLPYLILMYYHI